MKHIFKLSLVLLFFTIRANSQEVLDGVWGIKFGTSLDSAKIFANKKAGSIPKVSDGGEVLTYSDCTFGTRKAAVLKLMFYNKKFYTAIAYFFPDNDPEIISLYKSLRSDVSKKWWEPQVNAESYKYPYEKGDGHEVTAIRLGYATIGCIWSFPESSRDEKNGSIMLIVDSKMWVELHYVDGDISKEVNRKLEEKSSKDF